MSAHIQVDLHVSSHTSGLACQLVYQLTQLLVLNSHVSSHTSGLASQLVYQLTQLLVFLLTCQLTYKWTCMSACVSADTTFGLFTNMSAHIQVDLHVSLCIS